MSVNVSSFIRYGLAPQDVHADHIMLVESFGPSLRDAILDLILNHGLVWALCQGLSQRLLMQLVKFVVKLGDHLLDVCTFFLSIKSLEDCNLDVLL
jgi:hypothetical protein